MVLHAWFDDCNHSGIYHKSAEAALTTFILQYLCVSLNSLAPR